MGRKTKNVMRNLLNMATDNDCELLLVMKDKNGALEQISTKPKEFNISHLAEAKPNPTLNFANEDAIKQFVSSLTNDTNLSQASTHVSLVDSKRGPEEKTLPPKLGKHSTPEPPVLTA